MAASRPCAFAGPSVPAAASSLKEKGGKKASGQHHHRSTCIEFILPFRSVEHAEWKIISKL